MLMLASGAGSWEQYFRTLSWGVRALDASDQLEAQRLHGLMANHHDEMSAASEEILMTESLAISSLFCPRSDQMFDEPTGDI